MPLHRRPPPLKSSLFVLALVEHSPSRMAPWVKDGCTKQITGDRNICARIVPNTPGGRGQIRQAHAEGEQSDPQVQSKPLTGPVQKINSFSCTH